MSVITNLDEAVADVFHGYQCLIKMSVYSA